MNKIQIECLINLSFVYLEWRNKTVLQLIKTSVLDTSSNSKKKKSFKIGNNLKNSKIKKISRKFDEDKTNSNVRRRQKSLENVQIFHHTCRNV